MGDTRFEEDRKLFIKFLGVCAIAMAALLLAAIAVRAAIFASYTGNDDAEEPISTSVYEAQSFKPTDTGTTDDVQVRVWSQIATGTLTAKIFAADGSSNPTGSALCTGSINNSTLDASSPGSMRTITCSGASLTSGTTYVLELSSSVANVGGSRVQWRDDESSPAYADGCGKQSTDSGSTWGGCFSDYTFIIDATASGGGAGGGTATTTTSTAQLINDPTTDLYHGFILFFISFFGMILILRKRRG